jgi:predicted nucleotidyltransferase
MTIEEKTQKAVELLLKVARPQKIILFGSYAHGNPGPDSDLDLMVIFGKELADPQQERLRLRRALDPLAMPIDVVVVTEEGFRYWADTINHLYHEVATEGRVLYEKAA